MKKITFKEIYISNLLLQWKFMAGSSSGSSGSGLVMKNQDFSFIFQGGFYIAEIQVPVRHINELLMNY